MRRILFWITAVAMLGFAGPGLALDGGFDCAEGSDEDLMSESQSVEPTSLSTTPVS